MFTFIYLLLWAVYILRLRIISSLWQVRKLKLQKVKMPGVTWLQKGVGSGGDSTQESLEAGMGQLEAHVTERLWEALDTFYPAISPSSNLLLPEIPPEAGPQPGHSGFWHLGKGGFCGEHCLGHRPSPGPASSAFSGPHPWSHVLAWGPSNPDSPCLVPTTNSPRITHPTTHLGMRVRNTSVCTALLPPQEGWTQWAI